jgi:hypothetical protein
MNDDELSAGAVKEAGLKRLTEMRQEHQDLDASIHALEQILLPDQLMIARLKRKKLALRDDITRLEDEILPDIIA